jgi:hypothetical protein
VLFPFFIFEFWHKDNNFIRILPHFLQNNFECKQIFFLFTRFFYVHNSLTIKTLTIMKKQFLFLSASLLMAGVANAYTGDGSEANPYVINDVAALQQLATEVNGGTGYAGSHFRLTADIDLQGVTWTPIGYGTNGNNVQRRFSRRRTLCLQRNSNRRNRYRLFRFRIGRYY